MTICDIQLLLDSTMSDCNRFLLLAIGKDPIESSFYSLSFIFRPLCERETIYKYTLVFEYSFR